MKDYLHDLSKMKLFSGMKTNEIEKLLDCLEAKLVHYASGEFIIEEGDNIHTFGIMLSGHARSIKWDSSDRIIILTLLEKGSEIGIMLAAQPEKESPVYVQAQEDVTVLQISYDLMFTNPVKVCLKYEIFLRNYIAIVAEKGILLHERITCLTKTTVREKILTYLYDISHKQKSSVIQLPLNRNALSEYLNIERSALSRELSNMKKDGLIDYHLNTFKLL